MEEVVKNVEETACEESKKKRGRRTAKDKKMYFGDEQEKAVADYIATEDAEEKDRIFNKVLKPAFTKMIESIIRRYSLYPPDEEFDETFNDTLSFLMTKISCFNPKSNFKAYSYCGTICKNYLIFKINQFAKQQKRNVSYDGGEEPIINKLSDDIQYSYSDGVSGSKVACDLTGVALNSIDKIINNEAISSGLTENEMAVGKALSYIMNHWEDMFVCVGSDKFNKSSIALFIREETNLSPKEIRDAMKVFKQGYFDDKMKYLKE